MSSPSDSSPSDTSVSQWIVTLIPTLIIGAVYLIAFIAVRKFQKRVYQPRVEVETVPKDLKPDDSPKGAFAWLTHLLKKPASFIIQETGADGYFFLRFLFRLFAVLALGILVTWPILFAVNATGGNGQVGFNLISYSNVNNKWRFLAHIFVSWIFFGSIIFLIYREIVYYTTFRHVLQTTPLYDSLLSSRTLLLTEIPKNLYDEEELRKLFPPARNIWYGRDYKDLQKDVKERTKLAGKYEGALNKVIAKSVKLRNKLQKKNKPLPEPANELNKYLKDGKKRPTHRLKFLIGKKVDTLDYGVERLGELNEKIAKAQEEHKTNEQVPAVFLEFPTQLELQKAYQAVPYNPELKGVKRFTGLSPDDVIWENLSLTAGKRRVKKIIASTILTLMIVFWCIPVAVVGAISNINLLTDKVHFLRFILKLPSFLMGLITGLLPVVALAVLMMFVPIFIKKMGSISGCITVQQIEGYCQSWFYAFIVVNSFIVITLTSAAASSVTSIIKDPPSALSLLASRLPKASNFYVSYFCLAGLAGPSSMLLQVVALILAQFLGKILDSTPRAKWNRWNNLGSPAWSTTYPSYELYAVIALSYAIIAPVIIGFASVTFLLFYFAFLYVLVYVNAPNKNDARGRNYPRALLELYTGLYLAEVCLICMFVFGKNWVAVALEAVIGAVTLVSHLYIKYTFLPLFDIVPISAIKYASGDTTYTYPIHDQGRKEIKTEGINYWDGGNELGVEELPPTIKTDRQGSETTATGAESSKVGGAESDVSEKPHSDEEVVEGHKSAAAAVVGAPAKGVSWLTRFFHPKKETFDLIRTDMPNAYYNYIEYNPEFLKTAYDDPAVTDDEPHIWVPKDDLGLSTIEKNKALENGVDVSDENAGFDEKHSVEYTGPPPSYEEALRV
ncbi:uncharacterized protein RJT21DRAFT_50437 [Scheffersomyces amazonensis]|uniref:uncharacterized protein n=1 Tax=Scheffersomyces amazonensis TaxID=1078765 RepID=UPI00315D19F0